MKSKFQTLQCPHYSLNLNRIGGFLYAKKRLKALCGEIKPDIIHSQGIRGDLLCQDITPEDKHILSIRNFPSEDYPTQFGFIKGNLMANKHFNIINKAIYPVACSKMLSLKFKEKKNMSLLYIQNGVDTEEYIPAENNSCKNQLKKKHGYNESDIIFITTGILIPRKNVETIIKAFLLNQNKSFRLIIAGEGNETKKLKKTATDDNRILFTGYSHNILEYLQMSDCYVSASLSEGLPNSVLEAMACGLPCILSDIPSHRELFESSDWNKFFQPDDYIALHGLLNELPYNDSNTISDNIKDIVEQNFSALTMSEKYQELYRELLKYIE